MALINIINQMIPQFITYSPNSRNVDDNIKDLSFWGISDYWGNTQKEFNILNGNSMELYTTEDVFFMIDTALIKTTK